MTKVYRSKVDTRIGIILVGIPIALVFIVWKLIHAPIPGRWLIAVPVLLLGVCLPISIFVSTTYRITDKSLRIRCGFFKWEIPLQDISKVESTNDPFSSPALSLDRIRIEYGQAKSVLISPVNKGEFLHDLRELGVPPA